MKEKFKKLNALAEIDQELLRLKGEVYGESWKKRGGVGAFMMLARKWDRIEKACQENNYDVFKAIDLVDDLVDDLQDLGCYLWLVRTENFILEKKEEGSGNPYANIDVEKEQDPWDPWANICNPNSSPSSLLSIGDTELLDYYCLVFHPNTPYSDQYQVRLQLRIHYGCLQVKTSPPKSLLEIASEHNCIESFRDPETQTLHRFATPE